MPSRVIAASGPPTEIITDPRVLPADKRRGRMVVRDGIRESRG